MITILIRKNPTETQWEIWKQLNSIHEISDEIEELIFYQNGIQEIKIQGIQS